MDKAPEDNINLQEHFFNSFDVDNNGEQCAYHMNDDYIEWFDDKADTCEEGDKVEDDSDQLCGHFIDNVGPSLA